MSYKCEQWLRADKLCLYLNDQTYKLPIKVSPSVYPSWQIKSHSLIHEHEHEHDLSHTCISGTSKIKRRLEVGRGGWRRMHVSRWVWHLADISQGGKGRKHLPATKESAAALQSYPSNWVTIGKPHACTLGNTGKRGKCENDNCKLQVRKSPTTWYYTNSISVAAYMKHLINDRKTIS